MPPVRKAPAAAPTPAPAPVTAKPAPPPPPPPEPKPIELKGTGQTATDLFDLQAGIALAEFKHSGTGHGSAALVDSQGNAVELLANGIGEINVSKLVHVRAAGRYLIDISADGPWTANILQPRPASGRAAPVTLNGTTQTGTGPIRLRSGLARFTLSHSGQGHFSATLHANDGRALALLANNIGRLSGASKAERIPRDGLYWLDVSADGPWEISVSQ